MNLSEIRQILADGNIRLTKSLGQNFLHDTNQLRRIVEAAEVQRGDRVLEIGPGLGALTQVLLGQGAHVLAIEKDERLFRLLTERWSGEKHLTLLHADALAYLQEGNRNWEGWRMVSNLPYSVGSPILVEFAAASAPPEQMSVTVQSEVARRLAAAAGEEDYGVLSLLVQVTYSPELLFRIPAGCFYPPPDIESACVRLRRRPRPLLSSVQYPVFTRIVKRGFSQRRKMMMKLLKVDWPAEELEGAFAALDLAQTARAETVSLEQFVELTRRLTRENG